MKDAIKAMIQKQIAQHEAKRVEGQIAREYMYVSVLREVITGIDSMESEDKAPEMVSPTVEVIDG